MGNFRARKKKVAIFTPFHPDSGGGAVHIRSAVAALESTFEFRWFYFGGRECSVPNSECVGESHLNGSLVQGLVEATSLFLKGKFRSREEALARIGEFHPDVVWVVAMNEGVALGNVILQARSSSVHVSVHDEPASTIVARSRRYFWLKRPARRAAMKLLRNCDSRDVICTMMKSYYEQMGIGSEVFYRYIPSVNVKPLVRKFSGDRARYWRVGHIGSIYSRRELTVFLRLFASACVKNEVIPSICFIGSNVHHEQIAKYLPKNADVCVLGNLCEASAIARLAECDFLWAMYPHDSWSEVFRRTSLPTKLSTYLLAQKPILATTPRPSTLDEFITRTGVGVSCNLFDPLCFDEFSRIKAFHVHEICVH